MSMTSEKIQAPKPVGKFMLVMQRWHHIWHGEAQHTEPRMPMVKLYSEETVLSLLAERDADKALIAESVVLFETLRQRIAELEREKDAMTAAAFAMRDDMREARPLTVKLPKRATADKYVDGTFDNSDLAAIYNTCRLECEVKIKNACAAMLNGGKS